VSALPDLSHAQRVIDRYFKDVRPDVAWERIRSVQEEAVTAFLASTECERELARIFREKGWLVAATDSILVGASGNVQIAIANASAGAILAAWRTARQPGSSE
jgi:hypothetical protein